MLSTDTSLSFLLLCTCLAGCMTSRVRADVTPQEPHASLMVEELNGHLRRMSGAELDVVMTDDPAAVKGPAIQIVRNSKANEIGIGGILRPSFLFTGPKLEKKAPVVMNLERVLPGGG